MTITIRLRDQLALEALHKRLDHAEQNIASGGGDHFPAQFAFDIRPASIQIDCGNDAQAFKKALLAEIEDFDDTIIEHIALDYGYERAQLSYHRLVSAIKKAK